MKKRKEKKKKPYFCSDKYLQPQKNSRLVDPTLQVALAVAKFTSIVATESKSSFAAKLFCFPSFSPAKLPLDIAGPEKKKKNCHYKLHFCSD